MRKTSKYARKKAHHDPNVITYRFGDYGVIKAKKRLHGHDDVISRCIPYKDNPVFDGQAYLLKIRAALDNFLHHTVPDADLETYTLLAVSLNEGKVRAIEIAGKTDHPMVDIFDKACKAMSRSIERYKTIRKWGLDGPARQELIDAVSMYEEIFLESSPAQMHDAAMTAFRWIEIQDADKHKQAA